MILLEEMNNEIKQNNKTATNAAQADIYMRTVDIVIKELFSIWHNLEEEIQTDIARDLQCKQPIHLQSLHYFKLHTLTEMV